jgi:acetyltransferase
LLSVPTFMFTHYLSPLFSPNSVAIVGASAREGALGRFVLENMLASGFKGPVFGVNPKYDNVLDTPCFASMSKLPQTPDLIVVTTPAQTVPGILRDAGEIGVPAAVILSAGFAEIGAIGRARADEVSAIAKRFSIRLVGPNCVGIMRPGIGLNATFANAPAKPGTLALISQSGAVCTAILDWAATTEIGFSSVISLGGALDIDFGETLDFLVHDSDTRSILLYVEGIRDARGFVSALRAAARVKPVIVLKAGRHNAGSKAAGSHTGALTGNDAVFDAVLARCGAVRVQTSLQLFAAARLLANPQLARTAKGSRLAILTNGGGPGVVAADCAIDNQLALAALSEATIARLNSVLPQHWSHANPVDLIGDAPAERFGAALDALVADANVDAALVLFCPQMAATADDAARAVIASAQRAMTAHSKPVFTAWLGGASILHARSLFETAGIPNFLTPENAIEAFSYLAYFQRHQEQLLASVPAAELMSLAACEEAIAVAKHIRAMAAADKRTQLSEHEAKTLLAAFGLTVAVGFDADTRAAALHAARKIGYPVVMKIRSRDISHKSDVGGVRLNLKTAQQVGNAFDEMMHDVAEANPGAKIDGVNIQPMLRFEHSREVLIGVSRDPVFGPIIAFGSGGVAVEAMRDTSLALPPLNVSLAQTLVRATRVDRILGAYRNVPEVNRDALNCALQRVSTMACLLPWIREMDLNPVLAHPGGAAVVDARIVIDADAPLTDSRYRHMAIFPYPVEFERDIQLKDGAALHLRPIRPDDADRERALITAMSDVSRYFRFLHPVSELSADTIARFTQLDYGREMAIVAIVSSSPTNASIGHGQFAGVARYYPNLDRTSVEFAVAVADEWQGRGLGNALMRVLIEAARSAAYVAMEGTILPQNQGMLKLATALGFSVEPTSDEVGTIKVSLALREPVAL